MQYRNILQIASIFITALPGLNNELVLAQFSLALSYAAIFFIIVSFIQLGLQPEPSQFYAQKNYESLLKLFYVTLACIFCYIAEGLIIILTLYCFYPEIMTLFTADNSMLQNMLALKPCIILFFIMNLMLTFNMGTLRGFSDNFIPQVVIFIVLACGVLPWVLFPFNINLNQLITFFVISGLTASAILMIRLKSNMNQKL